MLWRDFLPYIRHLPSADQRIVERAFQLATQQHEGQQRASGEPFIIHPIAVARIVARLGADRDTLAAALLHDTVEDTDLTTEQVASTFGENVSVMIGGLTKLQDNEIKQHPTMDQKIESLRRMFAVMETDVRVMVIKLADRLHNMQTIGFRPIDKQHAVAKETLDVYVKIADRLCMRDLRDELSLLCHAVLEPELHDRLLRVREHNRRRCTTITHTIQQRLAETNPHLITDISFEHKTWDNLLLQYELEKELTRPTLLFNAVFRCESVEDCYRTLGAIHQVWPRIVLTFDDFINVPAVNGYRGLQTTVILEDGTHVRCKIRTHGMDHYAHLGIASVCFDARAKGVLAYIPWTRHVRTLSLDTRNRSEEFWMTLQSDILSEAFVIYGNENRSVLVPTNATALDGALYLYPETAMRLIAIYVNGKKVPPTHPLARADVLEITLDHAPQVKREWLHWTKSGIGNALIRTALAKEKQSVKIETGKRLLQEYLLAHRRGYLTELHADFLMYMLRKRGLSGDMNKLYVQIAEGRHLPQDIERLLYPPSSEKSQRTSVWVVRCTTLAQNVPSLCGMLGQNAIVQLRTKRNEKTQMSALRATCRLTEDEAEQLKHALQRAQAESIVIHQRSFSYYWLALFMIILWGLNPVVAKWLLLKDITPLTLVSIRMMIVGIGATLLFAVWHMLSKGRYSNFSFIQLLRLSILPSFTTVALAIFTYNALMSIAPSLHLTILRIHIVLLPFVHFLHRTRAWILTTSALAFFGISIGFLLFTHPTTAGWGIALSVLALCSYMLYATIVDRTVQYYQIGFRYPVLFSMSGLLMGMGGVALTPFIVWEQQEISVILWAVLYVLCCVFVPHALFHTLLLRSKFFSITRLSILEVPLAVLLEILFLGSIQQPILYFFMLALLLAILLFMHTAWARQASSLFKMTYT